MNAESNNNGSRALVVHSDENDHHSTPVVNINSSNNNEIVLDALPYVESLDPNYENYAIQLIEEELQNIETAVNNDNNNRGEHPLLKRLLPSLSSAVLDNDAASAAAADYSMQCPRFGDRAPMAAAYKALLAKKANNTNSEIDDGKNNNNQQEQQWPNQNPDPMATKYGNNNIHEIITSHQKTNEKQTLITDLNTSITTQKIKLEHSRHQLINLELQQILQTPSTYTHYNTTMLEGQIVNPLSQAVEKQRMEVDTINATRMEEQRGYMKTLDGLNEKYYGLIDKNWRLGKAISDLEGEVKRLEK